MSDCPTPTKHRHRSKAAAYAARDSLEHARGIDLMLRAYLCPCGAWHLGHPSGGNLRHRITRAIKAGNRNTATARRRRKR